MTPKSIGRIDTGEPVFWGEFPRNRILPSPSPSANLVGMWEEMKDDFSFIKFIAFV